MKKIIIALLTIVSITACGTYKTLDLSTLTFGMTTQEVIRIAGKPQRILSARNTPDGYQEVLEYQTRYNEVYALEFWDNYLTGYEYLYDDVVYVAPVAPPSYFPEFGRPIYIRPDRPRPDKPGVSNRPERPERPSQPGRPGRPEQPGRPSEPGRPERPERPTQTRPGRPEQSSPSRPSRPAQPETPSRENMTRPAETNSNQSGRENSTRENTQSSGQGETNNGRGGGR